jgi:predicted transcriptional regulator
VSARDNILAIIERSPGIHFRGILQLTGLAIGQVQHHLYSLIKAGDIVSFKLFRHTRYCTPFVLPEDRAILGVLQLPVCKCIILHMLEHAGEHCSALNRHVKVSPSTLSWYVSRLEQAGVLAKQRHGRRQCLHLRDPVRVRGLLEQYSETFFYRSVRGFMDAWRPR